MFTIHENNIDLAARGVIIPVKLWAPRNVPTTLGPLDVFALVDTSLANTRIQEGVATSLGLEPIDAIKATATTKYIHETYLYRIRLIFPQVNVAFEVQAVEVPFMVKPSDRIKCLIGRDVLKHAILIYNGQSNMFSLGFKK